MLAVKKDHKKFATLKINLNELKIMIHNHLVYLNWDLKSSITTFFSFCRFFYWKITSQRQILQIPNVGESYPWISAVSLIKQLWVKVTWWQKINHKLCSFVISSSLKAPQWDKMSALPLKMNLSQDKLQK